MKFYQNADLFQHLQLKKTFNEELAKFYFIEIACILGLLHEKA